MEALQYIYTSWKNGDSSDKGYMIYSRSEGISEAECTAIKLAMQYYVPKNLSFAPTPQEIADTFPYAFSYFILPSGRGCVAQTTYLGRDYTGRFGNYIIYALVFNVDELPCRPAELFAESYIKTAMTEEELNVPSPVPPLPPLSITEYASVINDEQLSDFLVGKEEEFAQVLSMVLAARDGGVPFYINDTSVNLVLWSAAIERVLPPNLAKKFTFNTYVGDHESVRSQRAREGGLDYYFVGVCPEANSFDYRIECNSSRQVVVDFIGGSRTPGINPNYYSRAMALSMVMNGEDVSAFGEFVESTQFDEISSRLNDAYIYYDLLRNNRFEVLDDNVRAVLWFGTNYCTESDNTDVGCKLLMKIQEDGRALDPKLFSEFWRFVSKYSSFMIFTLYDLLTETVFQCAGEASEPCTKLVSLLSTIKKETPQQYQEYLNHFNTQDSIGQMLIYLTNHDNPYTNSFYITWLFESYTFAGGLNDGQPISKLLETLLNNVTHIDGCEKSMVEILIATVNNQVTFGGVISIFMDAIHSPRQVEQFCKSYLEMTSTLSNMQIHRFEQLLVETPIASPIAIYLCVSRIATAKDPEDAFWRFYDIQRPRLSAKTELTIDQMVLACINNVNAKDRVNAAINILRRVDLALIRDAEVIKTITNVINECSVKELAKMDGTFLQRVCQLREKIDEFGLDKIKAVCLGELLVSNNALHRRPVSLSRELSQMDIEINSFDKSDYETYVKDYIGEFIVLINGYEDIPALMRIYYPSRYFSIFTDSYVSVLKKLEKKEIHRWKDLIGWTCVYLITADTGDEAAEGMYKPIVRYLRSFGEEDLMEIQQRVLKEAPVASCERLFDEVRRKEGLSEKLGSLFHKQ